MDELGCAEAMPSVLREVLTPIGAEDMTKQTACREYDVSSLTDHLTGSITTLGGAAGAEFPDREPGDRIEHQVMAAAWPAVDAWRRRGLDGTVALGGPGDFPAKLAAGILSIEFLVHAWDYALAVGGTVNVSDEVADYVLGLANTVITPDGRSAVGFDQPVEILCDATVFDRPIAYTGRHPAS